MVLRRPVELAAVTGKVEIGVGNYVTPSISGRNTFSPYPIPKNSP